MNRNNFYFLSFITFLVGFQWAAAQETTLFEQEVALNGTALAASSTEARTVHLADDFILTSGAQLNMITLDGAQILQNLPSILQSVDVFIIQADDLTVAPINENIIYQSLQNMDNIDLVSISFDQTFYINLEDANVILEPNVKYWIVFSTYIDTPYPSSMTDWHNKPGQNTPGTSLAKVYTNGAWTTMESGMTFKLSGTTNLGTNDIIKHQLPILAATVVQSSLDVRVENFKSLQVYDFSGKLVLTSDQLITPVSFLIPGTYIAVVTDWTGENFKTKFIKK